jgi:uncharacterized iron-regulated membrane protein
VWRWHFFAGLFVAPFAVFLAVTGSLYLWKPQYEEWRYRELFNVPAETQPISVDAQFASAQAALPALKPVQFTPSFRPGRTSELVGRSKEGKTSVFVNPYTGQVVGTLREDDRLMRTLHELHGNLLAGRAGEIIVEIAASWAFVLIVTGFYLWWPRPFTVSGFLLPRFGQGRRALLRDLHAVPAVWL